MLLKLCKMVFKNPESALADSCGVRGRCWTPFFCWNTWYHPPLRLLPPRVTHRSAPVWDNQHNGLMLLSEFIGMHCWSRLFSNALSTVCGCMARLLLIPKAISSSTAEKTHEPLLFCWHVIQTVLQLDIVFVSHTFLSASDLAIFELESSSGNGICETSAVSLSKRPTTCGTAMGKGLWETKPAATARTRCLCLQGSHVERMPIAFSVMPVRYAIALEWSRCTFATMSAVLTVPKEHLWESRKQVHAFALLHEYAVLHRLFLAARHVEKLSACSTVF